MPIETGQSITLASRAALVDSLWRASRARRVRSIAEWVEATIVIPDGPYEGEPFRIHRQPFAGLLFAEIQRDRWRVIAVSGPTQSGKTICGYIAPALWHLFEVRETVVAAIPDMLMANDKWLIDFRPVVEASPVLRHYLPRTGEGSKGGKVKSGIQFSEIRTRLRFMGAGGGDTQRAGFTSRVVAATEVDNMEAAAARSHEADKVSQVIGRTRAFSDATRPPRIYLECTRTIPRGRITREITAGTDSRIFVPCGHCDAWISPGRDDLHGWQDATTEGQAVDGAHFKCAKCGGEIRDEMRRSMMRDCRLVHRGQQVSAAGDVIGELPDTSILGFQYFGFHNLFQSVGSLARDEWAGQHEPDKENTERKLCQQVWGVPYVAPNEEAPPLDAADLLRRQAGRDWGRGIIPDDAEVITVGVDVHKWHIHYCVMAFLPDGSPHVVEHQTLNVHSDDRDVEIAIMESLRVLRDDVCAVGWPWRGNFVTPHAVWIDSSYQPAAVHAFCLETARQLKAPAVIYRPAMGLGRSRVRKTGGYNHPRSTSKTVRMRGENYYIAWLGDRGTTRVYINVDYWKSYVHERLRTPVGTAGAMTLYQTPRPNEHQRYVQHLLAEELRRPEKAAPAAAAVWVQIRNDNHFLDCTVYATVAAHWAGVRLISPGVEAETDNVIADGSANGPIAAADYLAGDDRPFLATDRD